MTSEASDYQGKRVNPSYTAALYVLTKVISLKLFLDCTQILRGCYSRVVWLLLRSFHFVKAKENLQRCGDVFFDILIIIT